MVGIIGTLLVIDNAIVRHVADCEGLPHGDFSFSAQFFSSRLAGERQPRVVANLGDCSYGTSGPAATYARMRAALVLASLLAASSAVADPSARLRDASANELCWDTVRGFAREKYPTVKLDGPQSTLVSLNRPIGETPVKESRKSFPGIRTC
jgi:hypothetical protein